MDDEFGSNTNYWPLEHEDTAYKKTDLQITEDVLRFTIKAYQGVYSHYEPSMSTLRDFYLVSNVRQPSGPADTEYGVIFRVRGSNHFYFTIDDSMEFFIYKHSSGDDPWELLHRSTSASIRPGESNELIVLGQGSQFTFCINQETIAEMDETSYSTGIVGIAITLHNAQDKAVIEYENYTVYAPEK